MNKSGPIIVIEDDIDDQEILQEVFGRLPFKNEILFFSDGNKAVDYLTDDACKPFLILSDVNMPKTNGFDLRKKLFSHEKYREKCAPYLFFTTETHKRAVTDSYALSVQGFFLKPSNLAGLESTLRKIIEYWQECISPYQYD